MENAQVAVFEDKTELYEVIETVLNDAGHAITAVADNLDVALEKLRLIKSGDIDCDIIILDGNLRAGMYCGSHAMEIVEFIEENDIDVQVIGFSADPMSDYDISVDGEVKSKHVHDLPRAIGELVLSAERSERQGVYASHLDQSVRAIG